MNTRSRFFSSFSARLGIFLLLFFLIVMVIFVTNWYISARNNAEEDYRSTEMKMDQILQQSILWIDRGMYIHDLYYEPPLREAMQIVQDEYNASDGDPDTFDFQGLKQKIEGKLGDEYHVYLIENGVITHTTDTKDQGLNLSTFAPELLPKFKRIQESGNFVLDRSVRGHEKNVSMRLFAYQGTADHHYLFEIGRIFTHYPPEENLAYYTDLSTILWTLNTDIISFDLYSSFNALITSKSEIDLTNTDNETLKKISRVFKEGAGFTEYDTVHHRDIVYTFMPVLQTEAPSTKWMNVASRTVYSTSNLEAELMKITLWYIGFLALTAFIALLAACTISRYLTRSLHLMLEDIDEISAGSLTHQVRSSPHHDLNRISDAINQMVREIRSHIEALSISESRYRGLFSSSKDAIIILDGLNILEANPTAIELFNLKPGYEQQEIYKHLGSLGTSIMAKIEADLGHQSTQRLIEFMEVYSPEPGSEQYLNIRINQVKIGDRYLTQVQIRDITRQQQAFLQSAQQESLKEAYQQISNILVMLPDPTFVIDTGGHVLFWNHAMEKMTGIPAENMLGKGDYQYAVPIYGTARPMLIDIALHPELIEDGWGPRITRIGTMIYSEQWIMETESSPKYVSISARTLFDSQGNLIGAIETTHDITSLKDTENALKMANSKLNLLSSVTRHDIMNKVMIGRSNLYLLKDMSYTAEQRRYFTMLSESFRSIEEFIAFTRTYQELGVETPVWQDVEAVFMQAIENIDPGEIIIDIKVTGVRVYVDPLFPKVCYNLVENAIRHSGTVSRITISSHHTKTGLMIIVEDDGSGISDDEKSLIFERGYGKNTGYGLFLSREILAITGIILNETGEAGVGARFEIVIPFGRFDEKMDST